MNDATRKCFVSYLKCPFSQEQTDKWLKICIDKANFDSPRDRYIPRKAAWYTSPGCVCTYKYSGTD